MSEWDENLMFGHSNVTDESQPRVGSELDNSCGFDTTLFEELDSIDENNSNGQLIGDTQVSNVNNCPPNSEPEDCNVDQQLDDITDVIERDVTVVSQPMDMDVFDVNMEDIDIDEFAKLVELNWNQWMTPAADSDYSVPSDGQQMAPTNQMNKPDITNTTVDSPITGSDVSIAPKVDRLALAVKEIADNDPLDPFEYTLYSVNESSVIIQLNRNQSDTSPSFQKQEVIPVSESIGGPSVQYINFGESEESVATTVRIRRRGRRSLEQLGYTDEQKRERRLGQNKRSQQKIRDRKKLLKNASRLSVVTNRSTDRIISESQLTAFTDMLEKFRDDRFDGSHVCHIDYLLQLLGGLPFARR